MNERARMLANQQQPHGGGGGGGSTRSWRTLLLIEEANDCVYLGLALARCSMTL